MDGRPIDPETLRALRSKLSSRAKNLTPRQKLEQMWRHGSDRRLNPYLNGQRKLVGSSLPAKVPN
ncbi:MAG: hypothetical protein KDL87_17975 [Verrucomicrobiae bacterium]|nr:hypothetical protein [Verrucomicrobiae bacterium]